MFDVNVWTDGSAVPQLENKPGGWAAILRYGEDYEKRLSGWGLGVTSQQMEVIAVLEAIKALKTPCNVTVHTDSQYVIGVCSRKFQMKANLRLWNELLTLIKDKGHKVTFVKVKGHSGEDRLNEECDQLAKMECQYVINVGGAKVAM